MAAFDNRRWTAAGAVRLSMALALLVAVAARPGLAGDKAAAGPPKSLYLTGQLLVATPEIADPRFAETVIYMFTHRADGASGFIVNKVLGEDRLARFLKRIGIDVGDAEGTIRLHYGGPVETNSAFVLHTGDYRGPETRAVDGRFSVTTEMQVLKAVAEGRGPRRSLLALGYSGWRAGQLEAEIQRGDWLSAPADEALIFADDVADIWARAYRKAGQKL